MSLYDALSFWKSPNKIRGGTLKQVWHFVRGIVICDMNASYIWQRLTQDEKDSF